MLAVRAFGIGDVAGTDVDGLLDVGQQLAVEERGQAGTEADRVDRPVEITVRVGERPRRRAAVRSWATRTNAWSQSCSTPRVAASRAASPSISMRSEPDVAEVVGAGRRGDESATDAALHEAVALEPPQSFSHRSAADPQPPGELDFAQPFAGQDGIGEQLPAELRVVDS